jgi:hypothetical protein
MTITEIKKSVEKLSSDEQEELFAWIDEFRENQWDQEIESDFKAGKLDHLISAAKKEFKEGKCQKL